MSPDSNAIVDGEHQEYIGDGVYVCIDPFKAVIVYTSDGYRVTNKIVLEHGVLKNFTAWLERTIAALKLELEEKKP